MKKRVLGVLLAAVMAFCLFGCGGSDNSSSGTAASSGAASGDTQEASSSSSDASYKIGVILVGDETEGYTKAHMDGIKEAAAELGIADDSIIWKYKVEENSDCADAAVDLIASGCTVVISNSYGHQTYMDSVAADYPDVQFVSMTGDFAAISGKDNFSNAFTKVYESRYVSGVVAGMKLAELVETGELSPETYPLAYDADGNIKVGYVGAYPYAEVVSGYTAFFLGIRSIVENVAMEVKYTNSWFDIDKEAAAAEALVANGCVIIGQHADSTGAPAAVQKLLDSGTICYSVGYNVDMLETAPTAALTSATNTWSVYYKAAFEKVLAGEKIMTNWAEGYSQDAVAITALGPSCAEGTQEKVDQVINGIKMGGIFVFDTKTFTVNGEQIDSYKVDLSYYDYSTGSPVCIYEGPTEETIVDGHFSESTLRSAPYFDIRIDGITEDAE